MARSDRIAMPGVGRRRALAAAGALPLAAALEAALAHPAFATPDAAAALLKTLVRTEPKPGRIELRLPDIAENGNSVPLAVAVESPMTAADHVKTVYVVADGNPLPGVAAFEFTPDCGRVDVQIRVRLAHTQTVSAVAVMSDGTAWVARRDVKVTIGGCGG